MFKTALKHALLSFLFILLLPIARAETLTPDAFFAQISHLLDRPEVSEVEVCIEETCEAYTRGVRIRPGAAAAADPSGGGAATGVADAVGAIVESAAKSVGVGGRVVVDYDKKADGSIKVRVEVSFGTGAGASAAAGGGSNPDTSLK